MLQRLIVLVVMFASLMGCGTKKPNAPPGSDDNPNSSDPAVAYTIQLRNPHEGDKTAVQIVETRTLGLEGPNGPTQSMRQEKRYEYTQHILSMPGDAKKPTKLTRTYTVAQRTDPSTNQLKTLSFERKTVTIEKKGEQYIFTVDGQPISSPDKIDLEFEFRDRDQSDIDDIIPKTTVRIGETWAVDPAVGQKIFGPIAPGIDKTSSQFDCKLIRVYTKDGRQYGVMSFDIDFGLEMKALSPQKAGGSGSMKVNATMDVVIDGSSSEGTKKATIQGHVNTSERGTPVKLIIHGTTEKTVRNLP